MVHGIQHNCSAFNRLIPLLTGHYNITAIDLPGHGLSSHFPQGLLFNLYDFVLSIQRVVNFLKWDKFAYVGHSFGGQTGTYYTAFFPEYIDQLIIIDTMEPRPAPLEDTFFHTKSILSQYLRMESKLSSNSAPAYTYEEAFDKVKKNNLWELSREATEDLMERAVRTQHNGDGYTFTCDQRLKLVLRPVLTFQQQKEIVKNINCPVLFILADENMERYGTYLKEMYEFNNSRENNTIVVVKGNHAIHQNYPERISFLIDEFLIDKKIRTKNH